MESKTQSIGRTNSEAVSFRQFARVDNDPAVTESRVKPVGTNGKVVGAPVVRPVHTSVRVIGSCARVFMCVCECVSRNNAINYPNITGKMWGEMGIRRAYSGKSKFGSSGNRNVVMMQPCTEGSISGTKPRLLIPALSVSKFAMYLNVAVTSQCEISGAVGGGVEQIGRTPE